MSKIIKAVFGGSAFAKTEKVFRFDTDDYLKFYGVDLPDTYQVHFANSVNGESKTVLGNADGVQIPWEYFSPGSDIYAWVWVVTETGGFTKYQVTIPVAQRAQPSDAAPTPQQQSALDQAIAALNAATEEIPEQIDTALAEAKASGEFDGEDGVGVPTGGTTGQVLAKKTDADYDTEWVDQSDDGGVAYFPFTISGDTATPGTGVTAAAIYQAYAAGYIVCAKMSIGSSSNSTILQLRSAEYDESYNRYTINFSGTTGSEFHTIDCVDEDGDAIWSYEREVSYNKKMGGIPKNDLASAVQTSLGKADSAYQKPALGIPATDLTIGVQASLARADAAYQKPQSGIPATDLAAGVIPTVPTKTSDLTNDSGFITGYTETDPTVPSWAKAPSKPSYTASEVGAIAAPASGTTGQVLKKTASGAEWANESVATDLQVQTAVDDYLDDHPTVTGTFTNEAKNALLALLEKVAYIDGNGQSYLDTLEAELFAVTVTSISAVFTQGSAVIYDTDSLDTLNQYLTVTATYSDSTTETVTTYTLSGTLTAGTSTITVAYGGKTTTFSVTVTHALVPAGYTSYDYVKYTGTDYNQSATPGAFMFMTNVYPDLNSLIIDFDVMPFKAQTGAAGGILGGQPQSAGSGNIYVLAFYGRTDTKRVSVFSRGAAIGINDIPNMQVNKVAHIRLDPGSQSPSTLTVDSLTETGTWGTVTVLNTSLGYFGSQMSYNNVYTIKSFACIGILRLFSLTNELVGEYVPCVRNSDNVIGVYDSVSGTFHSASTETYATIGNANCVYEVGNWEA